MDVILTVDAYYDGVRSGACTLNSEPMFYDSTWEDLVDGPDGEPLPERFVLAPISPEVLALIVREGQIWERWGGLLHGGPELSEANPGLADDRRRWKDLGRLINPHRQTAEWCKYVEKMRSGGVHDRPGNGLFWVIWRELPFPPANWSERSGANRS